MRRLVMLVALSFLLQFAASAQLAETTAAQTACVAGHYADSFQWPLLGVGYDTFNGQIPSNAWLIDPKAAGWKVNNGVGNYYTGASDANHPFHPGEDTGRQTSSSDTLNKPVYAPANGVVSRLQATTSLGTFVMIASCMQNQINWSDFTLPGTTVSGNANVALSNWVTFDYLHLQDDTVTYPGKGVQVKQGDYVTKGQLLGYIKNPNNYGAHLHFEVRAGYSSQPDPTDPDTFDPILQDRQNGYYSMQQTITGLDMLVGTAAMSRLVSPPSGLNTGLAVQTFDNDTNGAFDVNGWTPSGLWHVSSRRHNSGSYSFRYSNGDAATGNYDIVTSGTHQPDGGILMSPVFIAPANPTVKFETYYETEPARTGRALGSFDKKQIYVQRVGADDVMLVGEITSNSSGGVWQKQAMVIPTALAGLPIRIWFIFNSVDGQNNSYEGWYVDDVSVVADANVNPHTAVVTPIISGLEYAIAGPDPNDPTHTKVIVNGKLYGSNMSYTLMHIRFFGPGCETEGLCDVSANQSVSSSTTVYFTASLAKDAVFSVKAKNENLGLYASGYLEVDTATVGYGPCENTTSSVGSLQAQARESVRRNPLRDFRESVFLDSLNPPMSGEVVSSPGNLKGEPETDPLLISRQPDDRSALLEDSEGLGFKAKAQAFKPMAAATCSVFNLTPTSQNQTVTQGGTGSFPLGLSTGTTQQVSFTMVIYASAVPAGIWVNYPSAQTYLAKTSYPLNIQIGTSTATPLGSYLFGLRAWIGGLMVQEVNMTLVVSASSPPLQFTPTSQSANVVAGSSHTFNLTLKNTTVSSQSVTFAIYTMEATNPAGITASWPSSMTLGAGASVSLTTTIYTTTATPQRQINFELRATASNVTVAAQLAIVVTAPSTSAPTVTLSASNTTPTVNTALTLTATPSGGSGSGYACIWNVSSSTACQISYTPTITGSQTVTVTAKDGAGKTSSPASVVLNVQSASQFTVTLSASNTTPTVNTAVTLTASFSGNTGSVSCSWGSVSSSTACSISYTPSTTGNQTVTVTARDSSTTKTATASVTLNVQPAAVTLTVTPTQISATWGIPTNSGQLFAANVSYSNVPAGSTLVWSLSGLPTGVTGGTGSNAASGSNTLGISSPVTISTSAQPGTYYPVATISVAGQSKIVNLTLIIQAAQPSWSVTAIQTSSSLALGTSYGTVLTSTVTYANIPSGSSLQLSISNLPANAAAVPNSLNISGSGSVGFGGSVNVYTNASPGTYYPVATLTLAGSSNAVNLTMTIQAPPSLLVSNCTASASPVWAGQNGTFSEQTPSGGIPPYSYAWNGAVSGSGQSVSFTPSSSGTTYTEYLTVSDSGSGSNKQSRQVSCSVSTYAANAPPQNVGISSTSPASPHAGNTITINLFASGGFSSNTQVVVFGGSCLAPNGCLAAVVPGSINAAGTSMQAQAILNNSDNFQFKVRNTSTGILVLAGTVYVAP